MKRNALEYAFKLLGRRDYASSRLEAKLKKRNYSPQVISGVLKHLKGAGLLNDRKFALNYANFRLSKKPRGSRVLEYELFKKGIPRQTANEVIAEIYDKIPEEELIRKVIKKETGQKKVKDEIRRSLYGKLLRLGFSYDSIEKTLRKITQISRGDYTDYNE